ncbi:MAG TPA: amino acid ABC transporter substrate-binding protein [Rheinheimera sp.]|nr:amino acid ABC transporter substrate-binding protein [Rheinheimera sp.]
MQWMVRLLTLCAGILLAFGLAAMPQSATSPATNSKKVRIAAEDNWPPFSDERGQGLSKQLVQAALAASGYKIETIAMPYARALHETAQGDVDGCWNVTRQQSTLDQYLLHQTPLFQARASYYYHGKVRPYRSVADIPNNTVVGVILGYEYGDLYEQHKQRFKLVEVSTHGQLIQLLDAGKLDLAIFFDDVLAYYLHQPEFQQVKLLRGHTNHVSDIFVAFTKNQARSVELATALDRGLAELKRSGTYQRLLEQYLAKPSVERASVEQPTAVPTQE